jgi:hypothetical protein
MDGKQGLQLVQLISPKVTIPIHCDDYDVFLVSARGLLYSEPSAKIPETG